jgi:cobaltochelatase CobN
VLGRPRVDVVLRVSGFFRDAFPELIALFDAAVRRVAELDEPEEQNPLRARAERETRELCAAGWPAEQAAQRARWRVFGSAPSGYGAGLAELLEHGEWRERADLGRAYLRAGGYAYGLGAQGSEAPELFRARLAAVQAVLQNQDNREHDLLDSSEYYEFHGGLGAAVELARGVPAALYHGDHSDPEAPRVRSLREELARVVRSRVVNPKWLAAMRRHGYKGGAELAASVEYLFGYGAASGVVEDYQYALVSDALLLDPASRDFLAEHNPSALREMAERLLEAIRRGLWREPGERAAALEQLLIDAEEGA